MIKILKPVVERYLTPSGVLCLPKEEVEFSKEQWNEIPENEKVLFEDKPEVNEVEVKIAEDTNG